MVKLITSLCLTLVVAFLPVEGFAQAAPIHLTFSPAPYWPHTVRSITMCPFVLSLKALEWARQ